MKKSISTKILLGILCVIMLLSVAGFFMLLQPVKAVDTASLVDQNGNQICLTEYATNSSVQIKIDDLRALVNKDKEENQLTKQVISFKVGQETFYSDATVTVEDQITVDLIEFETKKGASVRLNDFKGLRFETEISESSYEKLVGEYGEENLSFGTIVTTPAYQDSLYNLTSLTEGQNYIDIEAPEFFRGTKSFYGSLSNVKVDNERLGLGYLDINLGQQTVRIYAATGNFADHTRKAKDVATELYNNKSQVKTSEYQNYIALNWYSKYTVEELNKMVSWYGVEQPLLQKSTIVYELSQDGSYCKVVGLNDDSATQIVVASEINGLPVKEISASAFSGTAIEQIKLPTNITLIGENAFENCTLLTTCNYDGSAVDWNKISVGAGNQSLINANIVFAKKCILLKYNYVAEDGREFKLYDPKTLSYEKHDQIVPVEIGYITVDADIIKVSHDKPIQFVFSAWYYILNGKQMKFKANLSMTESICESTEEGLVLNLYIKYDKWSPNFSK